MSIQKNHRLLDDVRDVMRLLHYSIRTERSYCDWIKRYVNYHKMTSRDDLQDAEGKTEVFLTHLAVEQNLAGATQNQAMNALVFLYKRVLKQPLDKKINAIRSRKKVNVPVVMSREEVAKTVALLDGVPQLVVKLLYGSGLRIMEAVRLRVQDVDFEFKQVTVRFGKGAKDRVTTCSAALIPLIQNHLAKVQVDSS